MPVTVIVPVYRGVDDVRRCLESVVRHAASSDVPFEVLAIDDASPEPDVPAYLDALGVRGSPRPVHRGPQSREPRLRTHRQSGNRSEPRRRGDPQRRHGRDRNAGSIVSPPRPPSRTSPPSLRSRTSDRSARCPVRSSRRSSSRGRTRRSTSARTSSPGNHSSSCPRSSPASGSACTSRAKRSICAGCFDEDTFGLGYGEEVDFCLRASRVGLRHLVEDSTFVYHHGAGSFGDERKERLAEASSSAARSVPVLPGREHTRASARPAPAAPSPRSSSASSSAEPTAHTSSTSCTARPRRSAAPRSTSAR